MIFSFMKVRFSLLVVCFLLGLTACSLDDGDPKTSIYSYSYDFVGPDLEWTHGFSDYPAGAEDSARFQLKYAYTGMPANLPAKKAIMLSGNNYNGDLFMFLKTKISGLQPHLTYTLTINIELASSAKTGGANSTETPGESVYVKVGATVTEPKSVIEGGNFVMNIDKGNGAEGGEDMVVIGDIAVPAEVSGFGLKTLNNSYSSYSPIRVSASSKGELWVIVGTDATQKGVTTLYYNKINIVLSGAE
jgi:hypothetical protein